MVEVNDQFPTFSVEDQHENIIDTASLAGKKFIIFSYPKALTPGCTKEACSVRDHFSEIKEKNVLVMGLSKDKPSLNLKFAEKHNLDYPLLSDYNLDLVKALGLYKQKKFAGKKYMGVDRSTFMVDETGKIVHIFRKVNTAEHAEELLKQMETLGW